ncbi:prephenate dehydrogenase/arogenate dehydrogenase family protein, partial [bacterium]|nr:prephenate dehydrogenase/arogenate dehydrogenase family protein [bacterium]
MTSGEGTDTGTLAIVGVGLLGGSVALAAKQRGLCRHVLGIGRNAERLQAAVDAGVIDSFATNIADVEPEWDLVVVGTPVDRIVADVRAIAECSRPGTLITDVGSVKGSICRELASGLPDGVQFVGSHPLAGSEQRGFEVATPDLFDGRVCVVTPHVASNAAVVERTIAFWESLGSRVVRMAPDAHDVALAT